MARKPRNRTATYWDKRALERLTYSDRIADKHLLRIERLYNRAEKNILREAKSLYANAYKSGSFDKASLNSLASAKTIRDIKKQYKSLGLGELPANYQARMTRLEALEAQIMIEAKKVAFGENRENTLSHGETYNETYYRTMFDISKGIGFVPDSFSTIDRNTMNLIFNTDWAGGNYSSRIWANTDLVATKAQEIIGSAIATGQSLAKTSREFRELFHTSRYYADRLIRTETNYFENQAEAIACEELGIKEYVYVAVLDNRTSAICQYLDGKRFKYSEREVGLNYPPAHVNCRSTTRPYVGDEFEPKTRIARDPKTGKNYYINGSDTYEDWRESLNIKYSKPEVDNMLVRSYKQQYDEYKKYIGEKSMPKYTTFVNMKIKGPTEAQQAWWKDAKSYVRQGRYGNLPSNLDFQTYRRNINDPFGEKWMAAGFSPRLLDKHYEDHVLGHKENPFIGIRDKAEYDNRATTFINNKNNERFVGDDGELWVYNRENNEFAKARKNGIIKTYFKPTAGEKYWERQKELWTIK